METIRTNYELYRHSEKCLASGIKETQIVFNPEDVVKLLEMIGNFKQYRKQGIEYINHRGDIIKNINFVKAFGVLCPKVETEGGTKYVLDLSEYKGDVKFLLWNLVDCISYRASEKKIYKKGIRDTDNFNSICEVYWEGDTCPYPGIVDWECIEYYPRVIFRKVEVILSYEQMHKRRIISKRNPKNWKGKKLGYIVTKTAPEHCKYVTYKCKEEVNKIELNIVEETIFDLVGIEVPNWISKQELNEMKIYVRDTLREISNDIDEGREPYYNFLNVKYSLRSILEKVELLPKNEVYLNLGKLVKWMVDNGKIRIEDEEVFYEDSHNDDEE